jgi:hypothetical protein
VVEALAIFEYAHRFRKLGPEMLFGTKRCEFVLDVGLFADKIG